MDLCVAFLRGMNLGGRRITNDELRAAFAAIGFADASPYQASGNVILDAAGLDEAQLRTIIEAGLGSELGYDVPTFVRSAGELAHIAGLQPFSDDELAATEGRIQVGLLHTAPSADQRDVVLAYATSEDRLVVEGRELWWLPRAGISTSDLDLTAVGDDLGGVTIRTQRTIQRLSSRMTAG